VAGALVDKCLGECSCAMYRACGCGHLKLPRKYLAMVAWEEHTKPWVGAKPQPGPEPKTQNILNLNICAITYLIRIIIWHIGRAAIAKTFHVRGGRGVESRGLTHNFYHKPNIV
jgi:hypothetical protein